MRKRRVSSDNQGREGQEPHTALRALARLLGRQAARQFLAQTEILQLSSPGDRDCNASRSSDSTTRPT